MSAVQKCSGWMQMYIISVMELGIVEFGRDDNQWCVNKRISELAGSVQLAHLLSFSKERTPPKLSMFWSKEKELGTIDYGRHWKEMLIIKEVHDCYS